MPCRMQSAKAVNVASQLLVAGLKGPGLCRRAVAVLLLLPALSLAQESGEFQEEGEGSEHS